MDAHPQLSLLVFCWRVVWEKGAPQVPPLRYAPVGMTILTVMMLGGDSLGRTAHSRSPLRYAPVGMTSLTVMVLGGDSLGRRAHSRSLHFATLRMTRGGRLVATIYSATLSVTTVPGSTR